MLITFKEYPLAPKSPTKDMNVTMKSSKFQLSWKYGVCPSNAPYAMILRMASAPKKNTSTVSTMWSMIAFVLSGFKSEFSEQRIAVLTKIAVSTRYSNLK